MIHRKLSCFCSTYYGVAVLFWALLAGCSKDPVSSAGEDTDRSRIGYIVEDNFNFSLCQKVLVYTGQTTFLKQDKQFTFLAPDDNAFKLVGIVHLPGLGSGSSWYRNIINYATLPGSHSFRKMPLGDNQPLLSGNGHHVYVSRYLSGADTITGVNGAVISDVDIKASNGYLQATTQVLEEEHTDNLTQFLPGDTTLTLFALAIQHSGLMPLLQKGEYTVLAPVNAAMRAQGAFIPGLDLTSPAGILATDPAALASLLKYHLLDGKSFLDRLHRMADTSANHSLSTLNGEKIIVGGNPGAYNAITFLGNKNSQAAKIYTIIGTYYNLANHPAGNGVVHHIDKILIP